MAEYDSPRKGGIIGINLDEGDSLIEVKHTHGNSHIIIATKHGIAIRFKEEDARPIGRVARGVRGISLEKGDEVVGMEAVTEKDIILAACVNGHGKRSQVSAYRLQTRGGKGVINIKTTERNGHVVGIKKANEGDEIMLMTEKGITIRQSVKDVSIIGRNAQGVRLVRLDEGDKLAAIATVVKEDDAVIDPAPDGAQ